MSAESPENDAYWPERARETENYIAADIGTAIVGGFVGLDYGYVVANGRSFDDLAGAAAYGAGIAWTLYHVSRAVYRQVHYRLELRRTVNDFAAELDEQLGTASEPNPLPSGHDVDSRPDSDPTV